MASLKDLINGLRNSFANRQQHEVEPSINDPRAQGPGRDELVKLVEENKLDELKAAFERHDLDTANLLHSVRSPEMVNFLVEKGADVNEGYKLSTDERAKLKHAEEVSWDPLEIGYYSGLENRSPISFAAESANVETVQALLNHGAEPAGLVQALGRKEDEEAVVRTLLDAGAYQRYNIVQEAMNAEASVGTIRALLEHGAGPDDVEQEHDWTPLGMATMEGRLDHIDALLDYGADINGHRPPPMKS